MSTFSTPRTAARFALTLLTLALLASGLAAPRPAHAASTSVTVEDFDFSPASRTIDVGDTVQWSWSGNSHSVTSQDGLFDSGVKSAGASFQFTFTKAGTYAYLCVVHPSLMTGTIVVRSTSATPRPTATPTPTPRPTPKPTTRPAPTATPKPTPRPTIRPTASPAPTRAPAPPSPSASVAPSVPAPPSAAPAESASPVASAAVAATASPSLVAAPPGPATPVAASDQTPILIGLGLVVLVVGGDLLLMRRRQGR